MKWISQKQVNCIKMISELNSQEEEGFITAKLVQNVSEVDEIRDSQGKECKPFSAFCMSAGQGPLRLQLPESLQPFDYFDIEQDPTDPKQLPDKNARFKPISRNNSVSSTPQHPYRIYTHNPNYQLVYSRNSSQQPIVNQFQYIRNEVMLQTAEKSHENKCEFEKKMEVVNKLRNPFSRLLRSFDYTLIREKENPIKTNQLLAFDSRFESGNLSCAYTKTNTHEYHLFIQNDTNSYGYNQWFYFSLSNIKKDTQYTFVIVNFKKKHSFFRHGYKPMIFSLKKYQEYNNQNGWYRGGYNIEYQQSHITTSKFFKFYKLIFTLKFSYENDYVLIAANLPYSFTRLSNYLDRFSKQFNISSAEQEIAHLKVTGLGRTFCGNNLPEIKITPNQEDAEIRKPKSPSKNKKKSTKDKKMIIFMARQHPGQTVSSFLMESILQLFATFGYETQNQKQKQDKERVKYLLKNFTIVIFPMINIDGVIYGNSRCDITGMDMNRRWKNPSKVFHPQLVNIKHKIQNYARKYDIVGCFDLHGHSKLYNVFCYSCKINPISCRILPYIISKETSKFHFPSCTFGITRYKSTTARAAMFKIIQNQNVLTIQSSYFGYAEPVNQNDSKSHPLKFSQQNLQKQKKIIKYFQPKNFQQIAKGIINGLQIFLNKSKAYSQVENEIKSHIDELVHLQKINQQNQASGSESDPEGDQIDFQTKINTILGKEFLEEATSFNPAQEQNIEIYAASDASTPQYRHNQTFNLKNLKTEQKQELDWKLNESVQKIQKVNKIRITKMKPDISDRKTLSSQKLQNDQTPAFQNKPKPAPKPKSTKKQTISFSFHKNFKQTQDQMSQQKKFNSTHQEKQPNSSDRLNSQSNQRMSFGIKKKEEIKGLNETIEGHAKFPPPVVKDYDCGDLIIISAESKEIQKDEKSSLLQRSTFNPYVQVRENDFFLKFQRFFPSQAVPQSIKKQKLSFLQQSIYKDDQRQILNTLMQNKRRLDKQKMQRQIQKSNISVKEKYNINSSNKKYNPWRDDKEVSDKTISGMMMGTNGRKRQDIVDFRTFKDREKLKMHIRQANFAYTKYMKKDMG